MGDTDAPPGWWRQFILASPARTAKLAVVRADGSPHVAPVWADLDGDQIVFMTSADTIKGKAIEATPKSLRWKARARVGERVRWYEQPEETPHH